MVAKELDTPPRFPGLPLTKRWVSQAYHIHREIFQKVSAHISIVYLLMCPGGRILIRHRLPEPIIYAFDHYPNGQISLIIELLALSSALLTFCVGWRSPEVSLGLQLVAANLSSVIRARISQMPQYLRIFQVRSRLYTRTDAECNPCIEDMDWTLNTLLQPSISVRFIGTFLLNADELYILALCDTAVDPILLLLLLVAGLLRIVLCLHDMITYRAKCNYHRCHGDPEFHYEPVTRIRKRKWD
jgi:hypothetical protein